MKAIAVENFCDEPRLMEPPDPKPGPGEVLVAIDTAAIMPLGGTPEDGNGRPTDDLVRTRPRAIFRTAINPIDWKAAQSHIALHVG